MRDIPMCSLGHPLVALRFSEDRRAMEWADVCVLVHPSGRDSHVEFGFMAGRSKRAIVLLAEQDYGTEVPDLMIAAAATDIVTSIEELLDRLIK